MGTETLQNITLFDKCRSFTRAREVQASGLYPYFKPISHSEDTVVVIEGTGLSLPIADLDRELKENGHFRDVLTEYSHALLIASMRTAACNGLHGLQERCARWILMTLDRVDAERFAVTKEFLAQLLGTNRPTVSVLVSVLEKAGMLNVKGRWVTVADRNRLKEAACECYDIIRRNYEAVGR